MSISKDFSEAVENGKLLRVRIMLKDILLVDPTAVKFSEMADYANSKLGNIFDEHDGENLNFDVNTWNEDYLNEQMVAVVNNFSTERVELLKRMVRHIYKDRIQANYAEKNEQTQAQGHHAIAKKQIGIGVTATGAVLTTVGICASQTALAIGGVAVAAVGIALIVTDKE